MIELTWNGALLLYLLILLFSLFALWFTSHIRQRRRKLSLFVENVAVCEYCHNTYLARQGEKLSRCPLCHSLNQLS